MRQCISVIDRQTDTQTDTDIVAYMLHLALKRKSFPILVTQRWAQYTPDSSLLLIY